MAYYSPKQRQSDGRWDFTCANGSGTFPIGYCRAWKEEPEPSVVARLGQEFVESWKQERDENRPFQHKYHDTGHAAAEEASSCHREYEIDHMTVFAPDKPTTMHSCQADGCGEFTGDTVQVGEFGYYHVCASHRTHEIVKSIHMARKRR